MKRDSTFSNLSLFVLLSALLAGCASSSPPPPDSGETEWAAAPLVRAEKGIVSSAHPLATEAGLQVLKEGGNAFDAAVAIAAALNVVEPMMSGIGGYGTILVYDAETDRIRFLNSSGRIPRAVDSDVFRAPTPGYEENRRGPKAVSTPCNVRAWEGMWKEYGRIEWHKLFQPAVRLAEEGFAISARTAFFIDLAYDDFPPHAQQFYGRQGSPLKEGQELIQRDLAATLSNIARNGADAFHGGETAQAIDAAMRQSGGFLSRQDLAECQAEWWQPIHIEYRGHSVYTASPPSTAFPSLIRLGIMSRFQPAAPGSAQQLHRFAEATKMAFHDRLAHAGDPEISPPPLERLLSSDYWQQRADQIDPEKARPFAPPGPPGQSRDNTTHFVVADGEGNIVSATQTLGNLFGSRIMPEGTGVWLNNSLAYCTFEPKGNPMDAHAGHHKLSGDCPTIILRDGRPWAALGTPGGHTIGQTVPQMVMNLIDYRMDMAEAISAPRLSFIEPQFIAIEAGFGQDVLDTLQGYGHQLRPDARLGNAHGLTITYDEQGRPDGFTAASDPRGSGLAKGY
ncbi:MAG TPA: gamma-glutamyltransferase [Acidobacteriota bacterium]|nr:gamma-glutamyltransferase [Acidobacteriota bacterium]